MPRYALVKDGSFFDLRSFSTQPPDIPHKGIVWLPCPVVVPPSFNPTTEKRLGPSYVVGASEVTESYTVDPLTVQEISDRKDTSVSGLNGGDYKPLLQILLTVVNDARATRAKLNALIDATAMSVTVAKFPAGQTTQIDMAQLKSAIKALL